MDWFPYDKDLRRERVKAKFGQKLLSRGVLRKRCSDNIQQIFRTPMASNLYRNHTSAWVLSCKFVTSFQNIFSWEHLWSAASVWSRSLFASNNEFILISVFLYLNLYLPAIVVHRKMSVWCPKYLIQKQPPEVFRPSDLQLY